MAGPRKKIKLEEEVDSSILDFVKKIHEDRINCAESILEYAFSKRRVRILSYAKKIDENSKGVVYWMSRDQRIQDNWALLFSQKMALKNKVPLHICFCLVSKFLDATIRHYDFLLKGLEEVEKESTQLGIKFHLLLGKAEEVLPKFVMQNGIGAVVTDFSPLRVPTKWVDTVKDSLPEDVVFCQVDAHNIVPCWEASPKLEYGARTIRSKINSKLSEFLVKFPPVIGHPYKCKEKYEVIDWIAARKNLEVDVTVQPVDWARPGYLGGMEVLKKFVTKTLKEYGKLRNDPNKESLSNLSPWFHFGQISVQRAILVVQEYKSKYPESVAAFSEEAIIRRELADNFCFYNEKYDSLDGTNEWAKNTLNLHRKDKRPYLYTLEQLENSKTHDNLWNAAQKQLVKSGKMHGFLRMYWAKKILEWTNSPEEALKFSIYLNDRYSLDGRDPNGFVGCMWSICGIHDQGWAERAVFGKIRYMNYQGCKRKFDVDSFICKWI